MEDKGIKLVDDFFRKINTGDADKKDLLNSFNELQNFLLSHLKQNMISEYIWKDYIINLLIMDENPFSLLCENQIMNDRHPLYTTVQNDIQIINDLFNINWGKISGELGLRGDSILMMKFDSHLYLNPKTDLVGLMDANDVSGFTRSLCQYYYETGCGNLGEFIAFKWKDNELEGIDNLDPVRLDDLVGYEEQKKTLIQNTKSFVSGKKANNVLLYGDKGTGKSSSVKATLNQFSNKKLRMIEITKEQIVYFPLITKKIKDRNYRFIIFIDDLSFEDFETEYKYFKAVLEGGLEIKSDNALIYVTSNRRHLIKEKWSDRQEMDGEVHINDSVQEKLSLVDRFGITINYTAPNKKLFLDIVHKLAEDNNIDVSKDSLIENALIWEMKYHGRSGRSARQYIDYLLSKH
jgi:hypothetical protein